MTKALKRYALSGFMFIFILRLFSDLFNSFYNIGWVNQPINIQFTKIFSSLLVIYMLGFLAIFAQASIKINAFKNIFYLSLFLVFSIIVGIFSFSQIGMSIKGIFIVFFRYIIEILIFIFTWNFIDSKEDFNKIFTRFFKPIILFTSTIILIQLFTSSYHNIQGVPRLVGPFSNPNVCGAFLNLFIVITWFFRSTLKNKKYWLLILIFMEIALFITGSMTSIIINFCWLFLVFISDQGYRTKIFYYSFPIIIGISTYLVFINLESILNRISKVFDLNSFSLSSASSLSWRYDAWSNYVDQIDSIFNLLFGLGVGAHRFIFLNDYGNNLSYIFEAPGTHNDYLAVLFDFGLIGLLFLVFFIYSSIRKLNRLNRQNIRIKYIKFYMYTMLIAMFFDNYLDGLLAMVFVMVYAGIIKTFTRNADI